MSLPSITTRPVSAASNPAMMRRARAIRSAEGVNTALSAAICRGCTAPLPEKPSSRAWTAARSMPSGSSRSSQGTSMASSPAPAAAWTTRERA